MPCKKPKEKNEYRHEGVRQKGVLDTIGIESQLPFFNTQRDFWERVNRAKKQAGR